MTRSEFRDYIKRSLGFPYIKVELSNEHLDDSINRTLSIYKKWAAGVATKETFFTVPISSGGQHTYNMPSGVTEVLSMNDSSDSMGSSNELFTTSNLMQTSGMLSGLQSGGSTIVNYHSALDMMDLLDRYSSSDFNWKYHPFNNTMTLSPLPSASPSWKSTSNHFMLIHCYMLEGYDNTNIHSNWLEYVYETQWIQEYAIALSKIVLGYIRRKHSGNTSIGNVGIELDGADMVSEGKEEKERLEEQLKSEEIGDGWAILIG